MRANIFRSQICRSRSIHARDLPYSTGAFDLITAFEVIEHLTNWPDLLKEAQRLLSPGGTFLVSTPNKLYYADQRREAGPNPFHEHEFEFEEFRQALLEHFAIVDVMLQNRTEAFVYSSPGEEVADPRVRVESSASDPAHAHFFLAVCAVERPEPFVYVPSAGNLLRERELHITRLTSELALKDKWLAEMTAQRDQLHGYHQAAVTQLEERNRWAQSLESDLDATRQRVVALQEEFTREQQASQKVASDYEAKVVELERDIADKRELGTSISNAA